MCRHRALHFANTPIARSQQAALVGVLTALPAGGVMDRATSAADQKGVCDIDSKFFEWLGPMENPNIDKVRINWAETLIQREDYVPQPKLALRSPSCGATLTSSWREPSCTAMSSQPSSGHNPWLELNAC